MRAGLGAAPEHARGARHLGPPLARRAAISRTAAAGGRARTGGLPPTARIEALMSGLIVRDALDAPTPPQREVLEPVYDPTSPRPRSAPARCPLADSPARSTPRALRRGLAGDGRADAPLPQRPPGVVDAAARARWRRADHAAARAARAHARGGGGRGRGRPPVPRPRRRRLRRSPGSAAARVDEPAGELRAASPGRARGRDRDARLPASGAQSSSAAPRSRSSPRASTTSWVRVAARPPRRLDRISAGTFHPDPEGVSTSDSTAASTPRYPILIVTAERGDGDPAPEPTSSCAQPVKTLPMAPGILARGPWQTDQVATRWREEAFEPGPALAAQADAAIAALQDRGSPSHDGLAARLAGVRGRRRRR